VRDAKRCGEDVDVHNDLGDQERAGGSIEAIVLCEYVSEDDGDAGSQDVIDSELLMLVGR
jgi:hypothetical protein